MFKPALRQHIAGKTAFSWTSVSTVAIHHVCEGPVLHNASDRKCDVPTCRALFILLFVCLNGWLICSSFLQKSDVCVAYVNATRWQHWTQLQCMVRFLWYLTFASKKLHDNVAAFLIPSSCLHALWRQMYLVLGLHMCSVFFWFEKHLNCVYNGI
jgi:hypothetical protein